MKANFVKFVNFVMSKEITNWKLKRLKTYGQRALLVFIVTKQVML